jgi:hypothetical protein
VRLAREDAPALIIVDTSQLDITEGTLISKTANDDLTVGMIDAYLQLSATLAVEESLVLNWTESLHALASLTREDALAIGLTDLSNVAVTITAGGDAVSFTIAESSQPAVMVAGADATSLAVSEASRIFASLATSESVQAGLEEAIARLLALLERSDDAALVVIDAGTLMVPIAGSDAVVIQVTEDGDAIEVFLNRLGNVLIATVRSGVSLRTVRAIVRAVRYLGSLYTVRVL